MPFLATSAFAGWVALNFGVAGAVTAGFIIKAVVVIGAAAYARRQQRKARAAALDSIRDRTFMVRTGVEDRPIVYGRTRLSGPFRPLGTHGPDGERFSFTVSLAGPLDAVEAVWFGDEAIGTLDASGWTTTGDWYKARSEPAFHESVVSVGSTITLPHLASSIQAVVIDDEPVNVQEYYGYSNAYLGDPATDTYAYSIATVGGVSVLTFNSAWVGRRVVVNYMYAMGYPVARALAFLGQAGQAADPYLIQEFPTIWTSNHRSDGASYLSCTLVYDPDLFPTGIPNVSAIVRGKRVYDPRTTLTVWSQNPALIARDYLVSEIGCDSSEIDDASVIAAANACDESVTTATGTQARYTFDGALSSATNRLDNLEQILMSMAGTAVYSAGKWTIKAGVYYAATLALDEDDLANEQIVVQAFANRRDLMNGVRGTYTDPTTYKENDFPAYLSATYLAQDNDDEAYQDINLPMVTDVERAQRIAKLMLFRSRQALTFSASFNLGAYEVTQGDVVEVTMSRYGWAAKEFLCIDREYDPAGGVRLTFREEAEAVYDWDFNEATTPDPAPNTNLPSVRYVEPPELTFGSGTQFADYLADGSVRPFLRVYWQEYGLEVVSVELLWRRVNETTWATALVAAQDDAFDIYGISSQETYIVQARAINGIGVHSDWASEVVTVDPSAPANSGNVLLGIGVNLQTNTRILTTSVPWTASHYTDAVDVIGSGVPGSDYAAISSYANELIGWAASGKTYANYRPEPYNAIVRVTTSGGTYQFRNTTNFVYPSGARIPCKLLDIIEVGAFVGSVGGGARIGCQFFDINGISAGYASGDVPLLRARNISPTTVTTLLSSDEPEYDGQFDVSRFKRIYGFVVTPANAVSVQLLIQTRRQVTTGTSTVSIAMPYIGIGRAEQLTPSTWSVGPES